MPHGVYMKMMYFVSILYPVDAWINTNEDKFCSRKHSMNL